MTDARVLVATDGREQSDGALRAGALFAGDEGTLQVLTVLPYPPLISPEIPLAIVPEVDAARRDELRQAVEEQIRRVLPDRIAEIRVEEGDPAKTIAHVARESGARLIAAGLGRHRIVDRVLGDETTLLIVREATVPVFAASPDLTQMPRRVVVGVDFSDMSNRAAHLAVTLAGEAATIYVVHVSPRDDVLRALTGGRRAYEKRALGELDRLKSTLPLRGRQYAQSVLRRGDPATELLSYAADTDADLVTSGAHGLGFIARLLVGSVVTKILRAATCSVLVVPKGESNGRPA